MGVCYTWRSAPFWGEGHRRRVPAGGSSASERIVAVGNQLRRFRSHGTFDDRGVVDFSGKKSLCSAQFANMSRVVDVICVCRAIWYSRWSLPDTFTPKMPFPFEGDSGTQLMVSVRSSTVSFAILTTVLLAVPAPMVLSEELASADRPIHEVIDHYINARLQQESVTPAPLADDANLIRRTTLDLAGRIPTAYEAKAYIESQDANKRTAWIDRLFASPGFVRHQTDELDTLLMHGSGRSLRDYLSKAVEENRPWSDIFRDVILCENQPDDGKGPNHFIRARAKDLDKLANETSVIFFGINVSCAKCHDHPLVASWTQDHFYGMKSFFSRTFENGDFIGEHEYGIVKYKTTEGEERTAKLMFLSGKVADEPAVEEPSNEDKKKEKKQLEQLKKDKKVPPAPSFSRRRQLVEAALHQDQNTIFARSIVNRLWYRLLGRGFVMPIDQMHPENEPTHPELLQWLARDLISHNYDLRRLIRGIVLSDAYARSSRWESSERPSPELFAVGTARPLTPAQYAAVLRLASTNPDRFSSEMQDKDRESRIQDVHNASRGWVNEFAQPNQDFQVSVTEALMLNNSERVMNDLLRDNGESVVGKVKSLENPAEIVEVAVWNIFGRPADPEEVQALSGYLAQRTDRPVKAIQQMVWALLTSTESRFNY